MLTNKVPHFGSKRLRKTPAFERLISLHPYLTIGEHMHKESSRDLVGIGEASLHELTHNTPNLGAQVATKLGGRKRALRPDAGCQYTRQGSTYHRHLPNTGRIHCFSMDIIKIIFLTQMRWGRASRYCWRDGRQIIFRIATTLNVARSTHIHNL